MTETQIHWDKGPNDLAENQRLMNHTRLAEAASAVVPKIVQTEESRENNYPVEKISGFAFTTFINSSEYQVGQDEKIEISLEDKILVTKQILEQMRLLLDKYGIVIADRNGGNILVVHNKSLDSNKWTIKQVDLAIVYDAVENTNFILPSVDLMNRSSHEGQLDFKSPDQLYKWLSGNLVSILSQLTYSKNFSDQLTRDKRRIVDEFKKTWSFSGKEKNGSRMLQIDDAISFLESLL